MKKPMTYAAAVVSTLALLTGCSDSATAGSDLQSPVASAASVATSEEPHRIDPYDYEDSDVETISLGSTISASTDAVSVDGSTGTITAAGVYQISGAVEDGQIIVDAGDGAVVRIILDDASITNSDGAAIAVMSAETAVLILADGSTNRLSDGAEYDLPEAEDEPNATLFSKTDLTVAGDGALEIEGNFNDGLASKDGLVIESGTIVIDAVDDAIRGRDYVVVDGGDVTIAAGGDGIKSDNDEDDGRGYITITDGELTLAVGDDAIRGDSSVTIDGGTIDITESYEGIESEIITINDGTIDITSSDDGLNVASSDTTTTDANTPPVPGAGGPGGGAPGGGDAGVGEHYIYINGGTTAITVTGDLDEQGDGIDANGHVEMTGGVVTVSGPTDTRNSAIDYSGGSFEVSGGTLVGTNVNGRNSEGIDAGSAQASLYLTFDSIIDARTVIEIRSEQGEELVTFEPANDFDVVVFTSPHLVAGESYEIFLGDSAESGALVGTATAG